MEHSIGEAIMYFRGELCLTQEDFAREVGVTLSTINRWENNRARPSPLALSALMNLAVRVGLDLGCCKWGQKLIQETYFREANTLH